jgi:hypothetical protein
MLRGRRSVLYAGPRLCMVSIPLQLYCFNFVSCCRISIHVVLAGLGVVAGLKLTASRTVRLS